MSVFTINPDAPTYDTCPTVGSGYVEVNGTWTHHSNVVESSDATTPTTVAVDVFDEKTANRKSRQLKKTNKKIKDAEAAQNEAIVKGDVEAQAAASLEIIRRRVDKMVYSSVAERIAADMYPDAKKAVNQACQEIYEHLQTRGKFYFADNVGYILLNGDITPIKISPDSAIFSALLTEYGILPGQNEFVRLGKYLGMKAETEGTPAIVRHSSYYNPTTKAFYFAESSSLIKGDGTRVERVPNGTDGVLFMFDKNAVPFQVDLDSLPEVDNSIIPEVDSLLMEMLFKDLKFKQTEGMLSDRDKRILLTVYVMLLLLPDIIKGRPLLQIIGPSGCGKSFFLLLLGCAIAGPRFKLQSLPSTKEDFENILMNSDIAFFDNISKVDARIRDVICSAVTGYEVVRRELFTTSEQVKVTSKTTMGLSALVPVLPSVEQANRSITLELLERGNGNLDEDVMLKAFDSKRADLLAEIITRAQMVLKALESQASYNPRVDSRLAGVATLILRVARHEGWEPEAQVMLKAWDSEQMEKALDNDEFSERVAAMMQKGEWEPGSTYTAKELDRVLRMPAGTKFVKTDDNPRLEDAEDWKGAKSLSLLIHKSKKAYERRFGLSIRDTKTHGSYFTFNPSPETLAEIRGTKQETEICPFCDGKGHLVPVVE